MVYAVHGMLEKQTLSVGAFTVVAEWVARVEHSGAHTAAITRILDKTALTAVVGNGAHPCACGEVSGTCCMTEEGYRIEATLEAVFLKKHRMEEGLYMGVIVSDCDRGTGKRYRARMTAPDDFRWCNPLCFVRII